MKSLKRGVGSGSGAASRSICQRCGSADPHPHQCHGSPTLDKTMFTFTIRRGLPLIKKEKAENKEKTYIKFNTRAQITIAEKALLVCACDVWCMKYCMVCHSAGKNQEISHFLICDSRQDYKNSYWEEVVDWSLCLYSMEGTGGTGTRPVELSADATRRIITWLGNVYSSGKKIRPGPPRLLRKRKVTLSLFVCIYFHV